MENKKLISILFAMLLACIMMFSIVATSSFATNTDTTDNNEKIITKAKAATCKVTLNANGGKIGTKTTKISNIKKGSKIGKQLLSPKRTGYTFTGWFTAKSGGTKITKNTKVTKKVTYFAQWTKKIANTNIDSKLVGTWQYEDLVLSTVSNRVYHYHIFGKDGTFHYFKKSGTSMPETTANYKVSNGKIYFSNITYTPNGDRYKDAVFEYKFGKDGQGEYLLMSYFRYNIPYLDISTWGTKFRK